MILNGGMLKDISNCEGGNGEKSMIMIEGMVKNQ